MKKNIFRMLTMLAILTASYTLYACQGNTSDTHEDGVEILEEKEEPASVEGIPIKDFEKLIAGNKLVMVDFYAVWCGPCKRMAPFVEQVKEEKKDVVTVLSIDAEAQPEISSRYNLEGYPTLIFFKKGQVVANAIGYHDKTQILNLINKFK
ncbi:MAG: thioredoxin [Bacteroidetes bacterium]|nr:thioredoxin [Bacteroidota bacterium]